MSVVLNFGNCSRFVWPFLYINWVSSHLMCIIQFWTTSTCSSAPKLVEKSHVCPRLNFRSHARNGNEIQTSGHHGSTENIEKLSFKILVNPKHAWKSWNLAWCHVMVLTCCGKKIGRIGTSFGICFLQTRASLKKSRGSERERVTFVCEMIYAAPLDFLYRGNIELYECRVKFWNYSRFIWTFLYINWVSGHLMCIIQIWTTSTCSSAPKLVEKSHVRPRVNF